MKNIDKISTEGDLDVDHKNMTFSYGMLDDSDYNKLKINNGFEELSSYPKDKLEQVQTILLQAYVYCHDELDDGIEKSISIENLEVRKRNVLKVRQVLRIITKYIESYDSLLTEFKEI